MVNDSWIVKTIHESFWPRHYFSVHWNYGNLQFEVKQRWCDTIVHVYI